MIDFNKSLRTLYSAEFSGLQLAHSEKFLLVVAVCSNGIIGDVVPLSTIRKNWSKTLFRVVFHRKYLDEALSNGWVDRTQPGLIFLTDEGLDHISDISSASSAANDGTELFVFPPKRAQDFDFTVRSAFASATSCVRIADSYVDITIFDTVLNAIPPNVRIELMFNHSDEAFFERARRFRIQYPNLVFGRYPKLHDRYFVVDDIAYVIGPSLKDAGTNSPAVIVRLPKSLSLKLISLFDNIFQNITKIS